ncbi:MAG: tRNA (adenosine(37)-N6)-threonylcarbamoyltransferase complex dimerization subunit type 1 TsaB [Gammaproteobacteria bacterium]|nr:tRNA (adenosine(37)-N6)-threonylcarbamoyltransferase complex dimerization subunit type 1 TsaB [Gammaproteobacteria bacterium]
MPRLLAIETATEACSVAIGDEGWIIEEFAVAANAHSTLLLPMLEKVLATSGWSLAQLDGIACGVGPGGFTGVRMGVSTVQGLAMAAGLPVFPVSSLRALAMGSPRAQVLAALDARRGEVYGATFLRTAAPLPERLGVERVCAPQLISWPGEGQCWGVGSGWQAYHAIWEAALGERLLGWDGAVFPHAADVLRLALPAALDGAGLDALLLEPHYIRPSQPEEQRP